MKKFKGKAIYQPSGKAAEYSEWACNFYVGCSNGCTYCYCKQGILAGAMGHDKPQLKACFTNKEHALEVFEKELIQNKEELQKHGLFFTFTSDPCLPETWLLTCEAINICREFDVPFKILTKRTDWFIDEFIHEFKTNATIWNREPKQHLWAFGFTLTGHDELEQGASTNAERIVAMKILHEAGYKTFASLEPVIDFTKSLDMVIKTAGICDLLKIGLESGKKYNPADLLEFINRVNFITKDTRKVYWKDSLLKAAGINRAQLPSNCVTSDFNLFEK